MTPTPTSRFRRCSHNILRWTARLATVGSIAMILAFLPGSFSKPPTPWEAALLLMFPTGVVAGMVLGWWRELWGGALTASSLAVFYILFMVFDGRIPSGPYFVLFASPGLLFLICGLLRRHPGAPVHPAPAAGSMPDVRPG